jgi:PEP-CTERM motif
MWGVFVLRSLKLSLRPLVVSAALMSAFSVQAVVNFNISFSDPGAAYSSYYADITRSVQAAGADWISKFQGVTVNTTLDVSIGFAAIATANGRSGTSSFVGSVGGLNVFEQGAAAKIKTGADANGAAADIEFNIGTNGYLQSELWFDPNPLAQTAVVPNTKTDARSVFLHEFGHAFGFNGWRNGTDGSLPPGGYQSTFDSFTQISSTPSGNTIFFSGPNAVAAYGGSVPITFGNYTHVGNNAPRAGVDLVPDLMNGIVFYRGTRYQISALDLAIMQDVGLPVAAVPEPATWVLMLGGVASLLGASRRRA